MEVADVPTDDHQQAVNEEEALLRAGLNAFPVDRPNDGLDGVGLEPEFFPILRGSDGRPAGRMPLNNPPDSGVLDVVDNLACSEADISSRRGGPVGPWEYDLSDGGRITFEPGGQVEHSTGVYSSVAVAIDDVQRVLGCLREAFGSHNAVLASAGMDIWNDVETVPQQLPFGRYTAQAAYYDRRGDWGRVMMRHTASLQINLDLGGPGRWRERWLAANLISPLITATFACSPGEGGVSTRARAWQELDPTRSGFPASLVDGSQTDPRAQWAAAAMNADVMLFRTSDGHWHPGEPGFTFSRWIHEGHPIFGWPTFADLDYHLTTLFFEVRPRGWLEMRAGEQVPDCWRAAQVVLVTAALYDDLSREAILTQLEGHRQGLPELWRLAAARGVGDDRVRELACRVWEEALRGVERIGGDFFGASATDCARRFSEEYTALGRTPADRLRELQAEDPAASLSWASSMKGSSSLEGLSD